MPNHVINQIEFHGLTEEQAASVLAKVGSAAQAIDFEVLLPIPLNIWRYSVGSKHEKAFPGNALDWCRANWSTKWNAYGIDQGGKYESVARSGGDITLTFQTAWGPPMGWILALFNLLELPFEYRWLSEGGEPARRGTFRKPEGSFDEPWHEDDADEQTTRHLHKLLWGVEEF